MKTNLFFKRYQPLMATSGQLRLFESFSDAREAAANFGGKRHLWTLIEREEGGAFVVVPGRQVVDVAGYLVTTEPWEDGAEEFAWPLWRSRKSAAA